MKLKSIQFKGEYWNNILILTTAIRAIINDGDQALLVVECEPPAYFPLEQSVTSQMNIPAIDIVNKFKEKNVIYPYDTYNNFYRLLYEFVKEEEHSRAYIAERLQEEELERRSRDD